MNFFEPRQLQGKNCLNSNININATNENKVYMNISKYRTYTIYVFHQAEFSSYIQLNKAEERELMAEEGKHKQ